MTSENVSGLGVGMLIGVAVGVAIGMLYAPNSGRETRAMLMEKAEEAKRKAEELMEKAKVAKGNVC